MANPHTAWMRYIYTQLADGEWHSLEELINEAIKFVPPSRAYRRRERERYNVNQRRGHNTESRQEEGAALERAVDVGARSIVRDTVWCAQQVGHGCWLEVKEHDGVKFARRLDLGGT